jgi:hypothetical protein
MLEPSSSETLVAIRQNTWRHITDNHNINKVPRLIAQLQGPNQSEKYVNLTEMLLQKRAVCVEEDLLLCACVPLNLTFHIRCAQH